MIFLAMVKNYAFCSTSIKKIVIKQPQTSQIAYEKYAQHDAFKFVITQISLSFFGKEINKGFTIQYFSRKTIFLENVIVP